MTHTELGAVSSAHSGSRDEHCKAEPGRKASRPFPGARAFRDLWEGWRDYRELWLAVGWYDIRKRYRRSVLGPFWITISLGVFVAALSLIYVPLMGGSIEGYLPYIAFGFIAWQFVSQLVIEGCNVFIANGPIIQQLKAPLSVYVYELVWKHLIILAHNLLIYVFIVVVFGLWPNWALLLVVPAILLACLNGVAIGMLLGTLCVRFRDIPPIIATIMQMMFLLTPIFWHADQLPGRALLVVLNPFYYFVEIIRQPLLGEVAPANIWITALAITLVNLLVAIPFYSRFRNRVAYWL